MTKNTLINYFALGLGFLAIDATCFASDFHSARTASLGGAGHGAPLLNDSVYLNPSFNSFLPSYSLAYNFSKFNGGSAELGNETHGRNYNFSIQDGRSELFQAGVAYTVREDGTFIHFGASRTVIKQLGVGIGGKVFFNTTNHTSGKDLTFSVSGVPNEIFQTSFIVDNILETSDSKARGLYREAILGLKFNVQKIFYIYLDPHWTPNLPSTNHWGYELGLEFPIMQDLYLRLGNFKNANIPTLAAYGRGYSAGIGWVGPRIAFDYALSRPIDPISTVNHVGGVTVYF